MAEPDIARSAAPPEFVFIDKCETFADIVQVLRALHDGLEQILLLKEGFPGLLPPKVEEIVLEELKVTHEYQFFALERPEFFPDQLSVSFGGLWQSEREQGADLEL